MKEKASLIMFGINMKYNLVLKLMMTYLAVVLSYSLRPSFSRNVLPEGAGTSVKKLVQPVTISSQFLRLGLTERPASGRPAGF